MGVLAGQRLTFTARRLATRSIWVLGGITLLTIMSGITVWNAYVRQEKNIWIANVAGRQRMFVEKIAKAALALYAITNPQERERAVRELSLTVDEWERVHRGLQVGDPSLELLPANRAELRRAFQQIGPQFQTLRGAARKILQL